MRRRRYNAFLLYNSNTRTPFLRASSSVEGSMLIISRSTVWLTSCCSGGKTVFEDYINFDGLGLSVPPPGVQENKIHNFCFPLSIDAMCQNWLKLVEKKSRKCLSVNTCPKKTQTAICQVLVSGLGNLNIYTYTLYKYLFSWISVLCIWFTFFAWGTFMVTLSSDTCIRINS